MILWIWASIKTSEISKCAKLSFVNIMPPDICPFMSYCLFFSLYYYNYFLLDFSLSRYCLLFFIFSICYKAYFSLSYCSFASNYLCLTLLYLYASFLLSSSAIFSFYRYCIAFLSFYYSYFFNKN